MKTTTSALEARALSKSFGAVHAVRGIDLTVQRGEIVALLGPNGAGKTTTLDMILGLSTPSSGTISVYGGTPRQAIRSGRLGAVLQSGGLLGEYKVAELIRMIAGTLPHHLPVDVVLTRANLTEIANRRISKCSGGEQQRVRVALALLSDPDLLILDEATTGMDVTARHHFWDGMRAEAERGKTIVFATHYLAEAEEFAQRTVIMNRGVIAADGLTAQVRSQFSSQRITLGFDGEANSVAAAARLSQVGVVSREGTTLQLLGEDTVSLARAALACVGVVKISITDSSLDEAFGLLTSEGGVAADDAHPEAVHPHMNMLPKP
ncbi:MULTISPECIES: ABC transporter ATP-binding protein [unclassified Actinobaculum]|uniref:ABC transporter ATP-binding protein n=1 Tax=unclassified Actinobaculum TaxID=2609299 RepID=UPI000D52A04A|nr:MULTISPECIES: ABC transporter ATP-binding protein [unclassified Actinobaculum]AWE41599.1 ABC transporter ATP-binding protein [Actinobaculum sp. 313]RTE49215.1 ABC transporter ATP-binding protein [Actinobaculum sp. 352]